MTSEQLFNEAVASATSGDLQKAHTLSRLAEQKKYWETKVKEDQGKQSSPIMARIHNGSVAHGNIAQVDLRGERVKNISLYVAIETKSELEDLIKFLQHSKESLAK